MRACQREASFATPGGRLGGAGCTSESTSPGRLRREDIPWPRPLRGQVVVGEFQSCEWFTDFLSSSLLKWTSCSACTQRDTDGDR